MHLSILSAPIKSIINLIYLSLGFVAASAAINIFDVPWRSYIRN